MNKISQEITGNNNVQVSGDYIITKKVVVNQSKKVVKQKYPEGCVGFDTIKANYIGHLISRYNEYKLQEVGKEKMNYATFNAQLKKSYKIPPTRTIYNLPIERFEELCLDIQTRIDKTMLARKLGKGHKNYSTFEEYRKEQTGV
jgi:hypothetical protein